MISKACEHGIKALIYVATQSMEKHRVKIGELAQHTGTPEAFTAKVLSKLANDNLLNSIKGTFGGFEMTEAQIRNTTVSDVVKSVDGDKLFVGCALGLESCNDDRPCPMHAHFVQIRTDLKNMMEQTSIYDLAMGLKSGETILIR